MNRKVGFIILAALIFGAPFRAEALDKRPPWKILDEALTYLHSIPEVAWIQFHEHKVFISWKSQPRNFARINQIAAKRAAHAIHNQVTVYSLPPGETLPEELWNYEPAFLCKTIANPQGIVETNCR
jgi:hypothetical protein